MRDRVRVAVYVVAALPGADDGSVLCFDHIDFPEAGRQIPAGGVQPGETLEAAAAREVWEETGVRIGRPRSLGVQIREDVTTDTRKVTVFLAAVAADRTADRWLHIVPGDEGQDAGLRFDCLFRTSDQAAAELVDGQGEFLHMLPPDLRLT